MRTVKSEWKMCCPKCGSDSSLMIAVNLSVLLTPNGTIVQDGDHEWDSQSDCQCSACGEQGTVLHFDMEKGNETRA